uniref:t-SNARE coiled-coil homology domain-containing protein n=1 Tax=Mesocestoides corti TaxID=53468 RepID=A0A5K3G566_MESCO
MHPAYTTNRNWDHSVGAFAPSDKSHRRGILTEDNDALASELCIKVDMLRELSTNIGAEVRQQNAFLDGTLSDMFARSEGMLRSAMRKAEEPETVTRRRHSPSPDLNPSQNTQPPRHPHPSYDRLVVFKLLVSVSLIIGIIVADGLSGSESVPDAEKNERGTNSLSFTGRLRSGYAQFFLLLSPSSVRIQATPHGSDVDLYVAANNDILYFEDRIPQLTKLMASVSNSQPTPMVKLDPPLSWETISPPEDVNSSTVYWSTQPPFSLSSIGLGVESIHIPAPSADDFHRPVLVLVFAPSGGFVASDDQASDQHQYTIEVSIIQLILIILGLWPSVYGFVL